MKLKGYSRREVSMLALAHTTAMSSSCSQRVGAVAVKGGAILSRASNRDHNDPAFLEESKIKYHASTCAERRALAKLSPEAARGATIFVVRAIRKDDTYGCSKPCQRCQDAMEAAGVKKCVYID